MTYGYSFLPTVTPSADTLAIDALMDQLMWFRRRFASLLDQTAEPDDIEMEDTVRNREREA